LPLLPYGINDHDFDFLCWRILTQNNCGLRFPLRNPKLEQSRSRSCESLECLFESSCFEAFLPLQAEYAPQARRLLCRFTQHLGTGQWDNDCLGYNSTGATPSETLDLSELRCHKNGWISQSGLPIITWRCKSIQIPVGRIWGYTTHLQLKSDGHYDHGDRTYCLDEDDLIDDLNILWLFSSTLSSRSD